MAFNTNILTPHVARQAFGALAGMLVAGLLYVTLDQVSYSSITGLLVAPGGVISENANRIRVNDKNVDDETVRRIASRARTVAAALEAADQESSDAIIVTSPLAEHAAERRASRVFANQLTADVVGDSVAAVQDALHAGAPDMTSTALPSSGFGVDPMIVASALGAFAMTRKRFHV